MKGSSAHALNRTGLGQALIEVITALAVIIVVIGAVIALSLAGLKNSQFSRNQATATKLAQQLTEQVRAVRDRQGWTTFVVDYAVNNCYEIDSTNWVLINQDLTCTAKQLAGEFRQFSQTIKLEDATAVATADGRKVTIKVNWSDSSGEHSSQQVTLLTRWQ